MRKYESRLSHLSQVLSCPLCQWVPNLESFSFHFQNCKPDRNSLYPKGVGITEAHGDQIKTRSYPRTPECKTEPRRPDNQPALQPFPLHLSFHPPPLCLSLPGVPIVVSADFARVHTPVLLTGWDARATGGPTRGRVMARSSTGAAERTMAQ